MKRVPVPALPVARQFAAVARPLTLATIMAGLVLAGRSLASDWPLAPRLAALTAGGALLYALLVWTFDRRALTRLAALRR